jgi:hypothetical protein
LPHLKRLANLAVQYRLPAISIFSQFADVGGLMEQNNRTRSEEEGGMQPRDQQKPPNYSCSGHACAPFNVS